MNLTIGPDDPQFQEGLLRGFKAELAAGKKPLLEEFIVRAPGAGLADFFGELLYAEVAARRARGETPNKEDYRSRFSNWHDVIDDEFRKFADTLPEGPDVGAKGGASRHIHSPPGYEVLNELGRGGMGVVYRARQVMAGRDVALKMILTGVHAAVPDLTRFRTEVEAVARFQHVNIVQVFEVGEHDGFPFFSMEFCGDGSLEQKLSSGPLSPGVAAALVETLSRAMQYAHDKGIVHRDLKPGNVLFGENGTPKVADFGLAKKLEETGHTRPGDVLGTPSYMAPEQAAGKSLEMGPRSDVYALGAILYECLTGRPPFRGATPYDTIGQVVSDKPTPPTTLARRTPRDLETICLKCLEKSPSRRYASASKLAEDLRRFLDGRPIIARPVGGPELLLRWCLRNPGIAALTVVIALVLVAATVISTVQAVRAGRALERAEKSGEEARQAQADAKLEAENANHERKRAEEEAKDTETALEQLARAATAAMLGDRDAAGNVFRSGVALWERRVARSDNDTSARNNLATARMRLGTWHMLQGEREKAVKIFLACEADFNILLRQEAEKPPHRFQLANCLDNHGIALLELEQYSDAAAKHQLALNHRLALAEAGGPDQASHRAYLASTYNHLGNARYGERQFAEAEAHYQNSYHLLKELAKAQPEVLSHRQELAYPLLGLGQVRLTGGRPEEAQRLFREAIDLQSALHKANPDNIGFAIELGVGHLNLGDAYRRRSEGEEAIAEYRTVIGLITPALSQSPNRGDLLRYLAEAQAGEACALFRLKRVEEALQAADAAGQRIATSDVGSTTRVRVAEALALASLATKAEHDRSADYTTRAIALLEQARQKGFFRISANVAEIKTDENLAPLRENEKFRGLFDSLQ
jgi:eukaryotic-like serine/threonine-protein kinase